MTLTLTLTLTLTKTQLTTSRDAGAWVSVLPSKRGQARLATWGATVPGTYPTPEAGTCTPYVQYVGPGGKPPCASGTYPTREAGTRSLYVPNGGPGAYVSA